MQILPLQRGHLYAGLLVSASCLASAEVEHGSIILLADPVTSSADLSFGPETSPVFSLPAGSNEGDYWLRVEAPAPTGGVLLSCVTQLTRSGNYATTSSYPSTTDDRLQFIAVHQSSAMFAEDDINLAFAYFPTSEFASGVAANSTNNGPLTSLERASPGISFSATAGTNPGAEFVGNGTGISTLDLTGYDPEGDGVFASSQNGILLVNGAANDDNYALSRANADGTFTIYSHDNYADGTVYESDGVSFVYIPLNHRSDQIAAMGRIKGDGTKLIHAGEFSVSRASASVFHLSIPGRDPSTGTLIVSPEGGDGGNVDNIVSAAWESANNRWRIESRDLTGFSLLSNVDNEPVFSFAFIAQPRRVYVDADATPGGDGTSWATAYDTLGDALANAIHGDRIWVAEGSYYPDEGGGATNDDRNSTFQLIDFVTLLGGFSGNETSEDQRNIQAHPTLLSGDLDQNDGAGFSNNGGNSYHVVTGTNTNATAVLDGFIITGGNANGPGAEGKAEGGGILNSASSPTIRNCEIRWNHADQTGGGMQNENISAPVVVNTLFENNRAGLYGGAVYHFVDCAASYVNCTFRANEADSGGAFTNFDAATPFTNCLFWQNLSNGNANLPSSTGFSFGSSVKPVFSHCLVDNSGGSASWVASIGIDAGNNLDTVPQFLSSSDPRLLPSSPLKNAGDSSANAEPEDLFGNTRIQGAAIDIGVYEIPEETTAPGVTLALTSGNTTDATTLTFSVTFSEEVLNADITDFLITQTGTLSHVGATLMGSGKNYTLTLTGVSGEGAVTILSGANNIIDLAGNALPTGLGVSGVFRLSSTTAIHYVDASSTNPVAPYDTWATAATNPQDALYFANTDDEVHVAEGTYHPDEGIGQSNDARSSAFTLTRRMDFLGGFPAGGGPTADPDAFPTILSGDIDQDDSSGGSNAGNAYSVVRVTATGCVVDGFEITAGNADAASGSNSQGGGLHQTGLDLTLSRCRIHHNHAREGGGAYLRNGLFTRCAIEGNTSSVNGAGIHFRGGTADRPPAVMTRCMIRGNHTAGTGGGTYLIFVASAEISDCLYQGNLADLRGGAMDTPLAGATLNLTNVSFQGNRALENYSVIAGIPQNASLTNCIIWDNAPNGFSLAGQSSISVSNMTFRNCLIANSGGSDNWQVGAPRDAGGNVDFDPQFVAPIDPMSAPSTAGDLHLQDTSLAIGSGDASANSEPFDLDGNPRIVPLSIDLGPYETNQLSTAFIDPAAIDAGEAVTLPGWASDTTGYNGGSGFEYVVTPVSIIGDLVFTSGPSITPDGTLQYETAPVEGGFAQFTVVLRDPNSVFEDSPPYPLAIRIGGFPFKCDLTATGTGDGLSWANAFTDPQDAINAAVPGDRIWIAQGSYIPSGSSFVIDRRVQIHGGFPSGGSGLSGRDPAVYPTILSGDLDGDGDSTWPDADNADHVVTVQASTGEFTLDGFSITRGFADGADADAWGGGILIASDVQAELANLIVEHNRSTRFGGGIAFESGVAIPSILRDSLFRNNFAGLSGGGVYTAGAILEITNCHFHDNTSLSRGGALCIDTSNAAIHLLRDSVFENNQSSSDGGGAAVFSFTAVDRCRFLGNSSQLGGGGGIWFNDGGIASNHVTHTLFAGNSASTGGGIYQRNFTGRDYLNCAFVGNTAIRGGGIYLDNSAPDFVNVTIHGNLATDDGGGIYSFNGGAPCGFDNALIWSNSAEGTTTGPSSSFIWVLSPTGIYNHCLIENESKADLDNSGASPDTNFEPVDPRFVSPVSPASAPTVAGNLRLLVGSPALDVGDDTTNSLPTDLAGLPRKVGTIDLGAYEGAFATFAGLGFTGPDDDSNFNGVSNFGDYAAGADPDLPDDPTVRANITGNTLTFTQRTNAADVTFLFEKSTTLLPGSWTELVAGVDYQIQSSTTIGGRTTLTLELLVDPGLTPIQFYRQRFVPATP